MSDTSKDNLELWPEPEMEPVGSLSEVMAAPSATTIPKTEGKPQAEAPVTQESQMVNPVMTINKFLEQDSMGWEESHKLAWIQYHSRKFLTAPEWKRILTINTNTRA
jgi:hypothetical protein